jgi:cyclophilin family peptidyl-prolyl cis-trans isomerase
MKEWAEKVLPNGKVFGEVTKGMEVVDTIAQLARNAADRPNVDVRMLKVRVLRNKFLGIF